MEPGGSKRRPGKPKWSTKFALSSGSSFGGHPKFLRESSMYHPLTHQPHIHHQSQAFTTYPTSHPSTHKKKKEEGRRKKEEGRRKMSTCLDVCLPVYLACLCVCLACFSVCLACLSVCLACLSVCLSVCLFCLTGCLVC